MPKVTYAVRATVDLVQLEALFVRGWDGNGKAGYDGVLRRSFTWVAACDDQRLVGFVNVAWDGGAHFFLLDSTVDPDYQRRGIGTELVRRATDACRGHGEWLHVDADAELMERLYIPAGFAPATAGIKQLPVDVTYGDAHRPVVTLSDDVVILRPWSTDDAGVLAEAFADPAIRRYNGSIDRLGRPSPPLSIMEAEALIAEWASNWRAFATTGKPSGGVVFAVTDATSGDVVGCCGLDDWSKADVAQFGYWLAPAARGHGYATRAVMLVTGWLFDLGAARVFLTIVAENEASIGVARRAGFVHEGTMRSHSVWHGRRCDVMWFAALPTEWTTRGPEKPT